jgi:hypothetical protein
MPPAALISSAASSIAFTLTMVAAAKSPDWSSSTPILMGEVFTGFIRCAQQRCRTTRPSRPGASEPITAT